MGAAADLAFKALATGLGCATIYLAGSFSFNVYRGLAWHNAQTKLPTQRSESDDQTQ